MRLSLCEIEVNRISTAFSIRVKTQTDPYFLGTCVCEVAFTVYGGAYMCMLPSAACVSNLWPVCVWCVYVCRENKADLPTHQALRGQGGPRLSPDTP